MAEEFKGQAFICIGRNNDLMLDEDNQIVARGGWCDCGREKIQIILCKADDESIEAFKGYLDRLRSIA